MRVPFDALVQLALLGTARQPPPRPEADTPVAQLQAAALSDNREETLLSLAAIAALYERVGQRPMQRVDDKSDRAAPEELPRVSESAGSALLRILKGEFGAASPELLPEWLGIAGQTRQIAPPEALPLLLEIDPSSPTMRELIETVLGQRGRWLARQNPRWSRTADRGQLDESVWETGEPAARLTFLQNLRRNDPNRARDLLQASWKQETAEDRAAFLGTFVRSLAAADEPLMEQALGDKRKEVRRTAAALLANLPGSKFGERMFSRLSQYVRFRPANRAQGGGPKKDSSATLEVQLPDAYEKAWQKDGIEARPPQGIGEKVWWLTQMIEFTPLTALAGHWNSSAAEVAGAAASSDWKDDLLEAWTRATLLQRRVDWADALFDQVLASGKVSRLRGLLESMGVAEFERHCSSLLKNNDDQVAATVGTILAETRHLWTGNFSREVLTWLRKITSQQSFDWPTRNRLPVLATRLAPEVLLVTAESWPVDSPGWDFWRAAVDELIALAQFRTEMIRSLIPPGYQSL